MAFNTSKCKVMVLNVTRKDIHLKLSNDELQIVDNYKYLGVTFSSKHITNLFKVHFRTMLEKANLRVSKIRRFGFRENGLRLTSAV